MSNSSTTTHSCLSLPSPLATEAELIADGWERTKTADIGKDDIVLFRLRGAVFTCHYLELYGFSFGVSTNQSDEELLVDLTKHWKSQTKETLQAVVNHTSQKKSDECRAFMSHDPVLDLAMIRVFSPITTPLDFDSLVHEIFHGVHHLLKNRGMRLTHSSEEAYAYLAGYMMRKTMEALKYEEPKPKRAKR